MRLGEVRDILGAQVLLGEQLMERDVASACGSDLMSDVLAFTKQKTLLLTGLTNIQVIRTADISDLCAIVFVRGKIPCKEVLEAAAQDNLPILVTGHTLFEACGRLYAQGLSGCPRKAVAHE
ncbi:MAG: DRTGG domain-containing protein [Acidaminococcaceae bacterium]